MRKLFSIFNKKGKSRTLQIGKGMYFIRIPQHYLWEYENGETLTFYPEGEETITARVNVLNFQREGATGVDFLNTVVEDAELKKLPHEFLHDGTVLIENLPEFHTDDNTDITVQSWHVAKNTSLIVFSITTIAKHANCSSAVEMKKHLVEIFKSVTEIN